MSATDVFLAAVLADHQEEAELVERLVARLADDDDAIPAAQSVLDREMAATWDRGWQPADVARMVRRHLGTPELRVLGAAVVAGARPYERLGHQVAPEWMAQVATLDTRPQPDAGDAAGHGRPGGSGTGGSRPQADGAAYLGGLDGHGLDRAGILTAAVRLVNLLGCLPPLPFVGPPPSRWRPGMATARAAAVDAGLLDKVRALLAKAESTTFEAEAEAFMAKAQELMTRHRIDRATLAAAGEAGSDGEQPRARRLGIDDPYAEAKALLLDAVCAANGGRSVWSRELGFSTVFAFADDIDAIEGLFTSLLVQATAALQREGAKRDRFGRSRTTRFRRSFLVAFATRIGRRLAEASAATTAAAAEEGEGAAFLPVLAAQDDAVDDAVEAAFPDLVSHRLSANDGEGWHAGTLFGDLADLGLGDPLPAAATG